MKMTDMVKLRDVKPSKGRMADYIPHKKESGHNSICMRRLMTEDKLLVEEKGKIIEGIYNDCLENVKLIFSRASIDFNILPSPDSLDILIKKIVSELRLNGVEIMDLFMRYEEGDYLCSHSVNVTFLSVMIGVWLNYNMSDLSSLATAALFHDIGMLKFREITSRPAKLNQQEREQVDMHPQLSCEFVEQMPGLDKKMSEVILAHHKRLNSSDMDVNEHAQIIGLVDTLEAMTHPRPYKSTLQPCLAIKNIIEQMKTSFGQSIIKALVDNIGVYPPGTWVRLDTKEIGLVIDVTPGSPLSPKLNIMFNENIERLPCPRIVDLSKQTNIYISAPLEEADKGRLKKALNLKV